MSFEAKNYPIGDILKDSIFQIPRNQRRYVWENQHWQDIYEDIIFSISERKPHFIGSLVLEERRKKDGLTYYTIIDGQQRLTTITILLIAIMKLFKELEMENDFLGTIPYIRAKDNRNKDIITLNSEYHVSLEKIITEAINLKDKDISITAFINTNLISKGKDKTIGNALKYFYDIIKKDIKESKQTQERLIEIRNTILDMTAVRIVSSTEEDSYTIFEILNARGQELDSYELLKNYIMRYIQPVEDRDAVKIKWEEMEKNLGDKFESFIKHYAVSRYGDINKKYSSPYQAIQKNTRGKKISELLDDIKLKSEYYIKFLNPSVGENGNCTLYEYRIYEFFRIKRFEQFRPIFLNILYQKDLEKITEKQYETTIKYIYNFVVCYTIIGKEKSNKLQDTVFKYAPMFYDNFSKDLLQEFALKIKDKIPSYEWFLNAFENIGYSNHYELFTGDKNKQRVKIILEIIERYVAQRETIDDFTIEHMNPDSESKENSQIGNLIPLEGKLNERCADKKLDDKYDIYDKSMFATVKNVTTRYKGKIFDPKKRTEHMAKLVYNNILELNQFDYSQD